jgi:hypothetical protein
MAWTVDEVIAETRRILSDSNATVGYRYTDDDILGALNYGLLSMRRTRPDLFRAYYGSGTQKLAAADIGQVPAVDVIVNEMYVPTLTEFMAGWIELADDEFTVDNRAGTLLQRFQQQLLAGG